MYPPKISKSEHLWGLFTEIIIILLAALAIFTDYTCANRISMRLFFDLLNTRVRILKNSIFDLRTRVNIARVANRIIIPITIHIESSSAFALSFGAFRLVEWDGVNH